MFSRWFEPILKEKMGRPYVHILFGARQTGKSTLLRSLMPSDTLVFNLADPAERSRHLTDPGAFVAACQSLAKRTEPHFVFVDEVQNVPSIFDGVQYLADENKTRWRFVLCGSSARKLRQAGTNLLPGRSFLHRLFPLVLCERPAPRAIATQGKSEILPLPWPTPGGPAHPFPEESLENRLAFGDLPGIADAPVEDRAELLKAFVHIHLQEEIRREGLVKDWGAFVRFLELAGAESGQLVNHSAIAQESGLSKPTIKSHYQLLEDMFVGISVPAFSKSPRKSLLSIPKFMFFDLGIRHAAAGLSPSTEIVRADPGRCFEQWVGIELWKRLQYLGAGRLYHQRTKDGAEIDFIVETGGRLIPIEVKWSDHPTLRDARHLWTFLNENNNAPMGYIVCRCPRPLQLHEKIRAIPWFGL